MSYVRVIKRIVENPYLNILVGVIFLLSGLSEIVHELKELEEVKLAAHHGVVLFAILHIFKTLPDFFEGLEYVDKESGVK